MTSPLDKEDNLDTILALLLELKDTGREPTPEEIERITAFMTILTEALRPVIQAVIDAVAGMAKMINDAIASIPQPIQTRQGLFDQSSLMGESIMSGSSAIHPLTGGTIIKPLVDPRQTERLMKEQLKWRGR